MHHTKIWGGHGPLAPPFPTPMTLTLFLYSQILILSFPENQVTNF